APQGAPRRRGFAASVAAGLGPPPTSRGHARPADRQGYPPRRAPFGRLAAFLRRETEVGPSSSAPWPGRERSGRARGVPQYHVLSSEVGRRIVWPRRDRPAQPLFSPRPSSSAAATDRSGIPSPRQGRPAP